MTRTGAMLLAVLTITALGLVTAQHKARKLFVELEQEGERARQLDIEYGQLQLESSTWSMHSRIERIARTSLRMRLPDSARVQVVDLSEPGPAPDAEAAASPTPPLSPAGSAPGAAKAL